MDGAAGRLDVEAQHLPRSSNSANVKAALADLRARHRVIFYRLQRLQQTRGRERSGAAFISDYEDLLECVYAGFDAEERILSVVGHPDYREHCLAHRRIIKGLVGACRWLYSGAPVGGEELLHSLDALVVHEALEDATFRNLEGERVPATPVASVPLAPPLLVARTASAKQAAANSKAFTSLAGRPLDLEP